MKIKRQQKFYISLPRHEEISESLKTSVKLKVRGAVTFCPNSDIFEKVTITI